MSKAELKMLERAFAIELNGGLLQLKNQCVKRLAERGYLEHVKFEDGKGWLRMTVEGYRLTHKGSMTYCATCKDAKAP